VTALFNIKKITKPNQCEAMRCTDAHTDTVDGALWSRHTAVWLCSKHLSALLTFVEQNPNYDPSTALVRPAGEPLAGVVIPDNWAENAYAVVADIRGSEAEAKEVLGMIKDLRIDGQEDMASVSDFLRDVKTKRNVIETGDKQVTGPLLGIVKRIRELIAPARQAWTDAESLLREKLSKAAVEESQRNQRLVEEAAEAHAQGQAVGEHLNRMTTATDLKGVGVKVVWVAVVDDLSALPEEYVVRQPDLKKLKEYAAGFEGKEPTPIPGVRFVQDAALRVTGKAS
jgi:hypothetical protein